MDDKQIVGLFLERSEQAIEETAKKYGSVLKRLAGNILSDARDAEECFSDTLAGLWSSIPPNVPDDLGAYAYEIARKQAICRYRKNTAQKRSSFYDTALDELASCLSSGETAQDLLEADELARAINAFLGCLPRDDRVMFLCRHYMGEPVRSIAEKLGTNERRVSLRLFRTREKLKKYLLKEGFITWIEK